MTLRIAFVALALTTLAACDSSEAFEIGGVYSGVTEGSGASSTTADFDIPDGTESGETFAFRVTVTETVTAPGGPTSEVEETVSGSGRYDHPDIALTVDGDTIRGTVSDDGDVLRLEIEDDETAEFRR